MKETIKGNHFELDEEVQQFVYEWVKGKSEEFSISGFEKWISRLQKRIKFKEDYVEK